jgi:hypothetical protein
LTNVRNNKVGKLAPCLAPSPHPSGLAAPRCNCSLSLYQIKITLTNKINKNKIKIKWKQLLEMENTLAACFLSPGLATTDISVYSSH